MGQWQQMKGHNERPYDILVAGEINPDLILSGDVTPEFGQVEKLVDAATLAIGSSGAIFACGAARLGLKIAIVGVCGEDVFGQFMLQEMKKRDVDVSPVIVDPQEQTGLSVILTHGSDRAILTHIGAISALRAEDVSDELLLRTRHLHVAGYFLQTRLQLGLPALLQRAHQMGCSVSLDTNWDPGGKWTGFEELLKQVDVFLPNENEALALTQTTDCDQAIQKLVSWCKVAAIKRGAEGALVNNGHDYATARALPTEVVDTVGAGDSFNAGFLYGWLNIWDLGKALQLGVVCGSLSTRVAGGTASQPTLAEAQQYLR
jgi:sugar/nucleoside kinase (ribokinase family)